jgi:capsular exopolysaccharide synthesis family protein
MAKTHEALIKAEKESKIKYLEPKRKTEKALAPLSLKDNLVKPSPEWCKELKAKLQTQYPNLKVKTIMFTGTTNKSGCTSTAAGYAVSLAYTYRQKVLLVDVNLRTPGIHKFFNSTDVPELFDIYKKNFPRIDQKIFGNLYIITCNPEYSEEVSGIFGSDRFEEFLKKMRGKFDYVILDGPPILSCSESRIISTKVDGVILMIESGKTRRRVALKAKAEIEKSGGNLLGVILNKREFHIPNWVYGRL